MDRRLKYRFVQEVIYFLKHNYSFKELTISYTIKDCENSIRYKQNTYQHYYNDVFTFHNNSYP